jgi:hypothetical protein
MTKMHQYSSLPLDRTSFNRDPHQTTTQASPPFALDDAYGNSTLQHRSDSSYNPLEATVTYQQTWVDQPAMNPLFNPIAPPLHLSPLPASTDSLRQSLQLSLASPPAEIEMDGKVPATADPNTPYSQLLYDALLSAPGHKLPLQGIYRWFEKNAARAADPNWRGWQNSIRHNLSMNHVSLDTGPFQYLAPDLGDVTGF